MGLMFILIGMTFIGQANALVKLANLFNKDGFPAVPFKVENISTATPR